MWQKKELSRSKPTQPWFATRWNTLYDSKQSTTENPEMIVPLREDCGAPFTDEEIDRAVGIYWTNAFSFSGGVGQVCRTYC